jgi:hypothetical protein
LIEFATFFAALLICSWGVGGGGGDFFFTIGFAGTELLG